MLEHGVQDLPSGDRKYPAAQLVQTESFALLHVSALVQNGIGVQVVHVSAGPLSFR